MTPALPDAILAVIDRLKFYGNNGYGPPFDRRQAQHALDELPSHVDGRVVAAAALAAGVSARGVKKLGQMLRVDVD
jgi:hypothetical protein